MATDFSALRKEVLSLRQVCALLPGRPNLSTLHRWRTRGVRGVVLKTLLIGGRRFVSCQALQEFIERISTQHGGALPRDSVNLAPAREREVKAAERRFANRCQSDKPSNASRRTTGDRKQEVGGSASISPDAPQPKPSRPTLSESAGQQGAHHNDRF